jgi:predicted metal-dependent phosphoesterase TrpH
MGVGVFNPREYMNEYNDIMKELADKKQLIIIIASEDYIYGTNYQFCHAYLSEELNVKQEKIIQAIGRVGRKEKNKTFTFRFKNIESINTLFVKNSSLETTNMNKLFFVKKI